MEKGEGRERGGARSARASVGAGFSLNHTHTHTPPASPPLFFVSFSSTTAALPLSLSEPTKPTVLRHQFLLPGRLPGRGPPARPLPPVAAAPLHHPGDKRVDGRAVRHLVSRGPVRDDAGRPLHRVRGGLHLPRRPPGHAPAHALCDRDQHLLHDGEGVLRLPDGRGQLRRVQLGLPARVGLLGRGVRVRQRRRARRLRHPSQVR